VHQVVTEKQNRIAKAFVVLFFYFINRLFSGAAETFGFTVAFVLSLHL
jgi:hypothetical protein